MAKSISVAVDDSDTIRFGRLSIVTLPLSPSTVTGKSPWPAPATPVVAAKLESATAHVAMTMVIRVLIPPPVGRGSSRRQEVCRTNCSCPRELLFVTGRPGDLAHRPPIRGQTASQLRDSAGITPDFA